VKHGVEWRQIDVVNPAHVHPQHLQPGIRSQKIAEPLCVQDNDIVGSAIEQGRA
jgi:hypothetical protein